MQAGSKPSNDLDVYGQIVRARPATTRRSAHGYRKEPAVSSPPYLRV